MLKVSDPTQFLITQQEFQQRQQQPQQAGQMVGEQMKQFQEQAGRARELSGPRARPASE